MRREVLQRIGGYQDGPFSEDYQLWLRLHRAGFGMAKLPQVLLHQPRDLAVWGAGRKTRGRVRHLIDRGVTPGAWIDIDPRKIGGKLLGAPVHPPEWLDREPRPFVLVYVNNRGARELIDAALAHMGYRRGADYLHVG